MRVLDRYLGITFILIFISTVVVFFSLYIVIDLFSHLDDLLKANFSVENLILYYLAFMPKIFTEMTPIAALLSLVYTLARLSHTNEIIAMRSAGLSVWQITKVAMIIGLMISCIIFFVNEELVPSSQYKLLEVKVKKMGMEDKRLSQHPITNAAIYGLDNRLFFISSFDPKDNSLTNVIVFEQDEKQNILSKIVASSGEYRQGRWIFYDCITYKYGSNNELEGEPEYAQAKVMNFRESPQDIKKQQLQISYMNIKQLRDYRNRLERSNATAVLRTFDVEIQKRFAYPLSVVVLMFISIPFSLSIKKKGHLISSLGISVGLGFFYYVLNSVSLAFGKEGYLPVALCAWLANLVFLVLGFILIKKIH